MAECAQRMANVLIGGLTVAADPEEPDRGPERSFGSRLSVMKTTSLANGTVLALIGTSMACFKIDGGV